MGQRGFFDTDERLKQLSAAGDPLERLAAVVDFELFRPALESALARSDGAKGGRPRYDAVLMFRVMVLQTLYSLSDDQTEYQLCDRLSFMRFVGLELHDAVPDAKTIWLYRERLARAGTIEALFGRFDRALRDAGYLAMGGQIVDATVVEARRPWLTDDEKATVRARQIDRDGRWTIKRGRKRPPKPGQRRDAGVEIAVPAFGYKNHIGIDRAHGFVRRYRVTHAAAHDGRNCATCSTATTPRAACGRIRPTAQRPTSSSSNATVWSRSSSTASPAAGRSPSPSAAATRPAGASGRTSSTSSPAKSIAWG